MIGLGFGTIFISPAHRVTRFTRPITFFHLSSHNLLLTSASVRYGSTLLFSPHGPSCTMRNKFSADGELFLNAKSLIRRISLLSIAFIELHHRNAYHGLGTEIWNRWIALRR